MAIAMECVNVVVPKAVLQAKYPGGLSQYRQNCPNQTFLEDEHLTRIGFMSWPDAQTWIAHLEGQGLLFRHSSNNPADIVVIDMIKGPTSPCSWIEFDSGEFGPRCWLKGTLPGTLIRPNRPGHENPALVVFDRWPP